MTEPARTHAEVRTDYTAMVSFIYFSDCARSYLQPVGSSSLTRD